MIERFVSAWDANKQMVREKFAAKHPENYAEIVRNVVEMLALFAGGDYTPDLNRIHVIDDGDYQGNLLFVIASNDYQTSRYWYVFVSYGSCSQCDTLEAIRDDYRNESDQPNESQVDDYMKLALHIVQGMKEINACATP